MKTKFLEKIKKRRFGTSRGKGNTAELLDLISNYYQSIFTKYNVKCGFCESKKHTVLYYLPKKTTTLKIYHDYFQFSKLRKKHEEG